MTGSSVRADLMAGISVAMVLVPQSMAYATLAGLPVVYGLYAAFLPVIVGTMWGSSRFLHTGPVALLSLMSAAALEPFAARGSEEFIQLALMLALMVGLFRLALGVFRLGVLINFASHPVIVGFTNAAALIIGLSLLNTFINVPMPRTDSFLRDLSQVFLQLPYAHWPTIAFGVATFVVLIYMRRIVPKVPAVLAVVVLGTAVSAAIGFEKTETVSLDQIRDTTARSAYVDYIRTQERITETKVQLSEIGKELREYDKLGVFKPDLEVEQARLEAEEKTLKQHSNIQRRVVHKFALQRVDGPDGQVVYQTATGSGLTPPWRFSGVSGVEVKLSSGGQVVGDIPSGLPSFSVPGINWDVAPSLFTTALIIAMIGFMEATSISRALAATKREKLDTNQELIGQGLANIVGSFFHAYVVSGSFSRSAVAAKSGAESGLYAVISAVAVVLVMLFLTEYLHHLPQAVLAAIVMSAVFTLLDFKALLHSWQVQKTDGVVGWLTFLATLVMAPQLADGILVGVGLTVLTFLIGTMRPRAEILGRRPDGVLAGAVTYDLQPLSPHYVALRFDASLVFINAAYFEEAIMDAVARFPQTKALLVVANGMNRIDASGEERIRALARDLKAAGCTLMFSGLKRQVREAMERAELIEALGEENIFSSKDIALWELAERYDKPAPEPKAA